MNKTFLCEGQSFVWDREKAHSNLCKHGISFEQACQVFFDPFLKHEDAGTATEQRDAVIGMARDRRLMFVVSLLLETEDVIRIISARPATAIERRTYEDGD